MIRRTLREWQRIGYGDDDTTIPTAEGDRIAAVAARSTSRGVAAKACSNTAAKACGPVVSSV